LSNSNKRGCIDSTPVSSRNNTSKDYQLNASEFIVWLTEAAKELERLGDQSASQSGVIRLPLSRERENGQREVEVRLCPSSRAHQLLAELYARLRIVSIELAVDFESQFQGRLETARQVALGCLFLAKRMTSIVTGHDSPLSIKSKPLSDIDLRTELDVVEPGLVVNEDRATTTAPNSISASNTNLAGKNGKQSTTGFLGGTALADALGIHRTRREAFFRQLERQRKCIGDDCWHEVRDPRPNSPRYLYRADSPKLRTLAESYSKPKAT
jgi:hypothetical protein